MADPNETSGLLEFFSEMLFGRAIFFGMFDGLRLDVLRAVSVGLTDSELEDMLRDFCGQL